MRQAILTLLKVFTEVKKVLCVLRENECVCFDEQDGLVVEVNLVEDNGNDKQHPVDNRDCAPRQPTQRTASMMVQRRGRRTNKKK